MKLHHAIWALAALSIWAWLARDLLTVLICAGCTIPYSVYLARATYQQSTPQEKSK